jgi:hypothetical protein
VNVEIGRDRKRCGLEVNAVADPLA